MTTQVYEFHTNNSPWTEIYAPYCQDEAMLTPTTMLMADSQEELQPTHDALADIYNRE